MGQRCLNGERENPVRRRDSGSGKEAGEGGVHPYSGKPSRALSVGEEEEAGWNCVDEREN